MKITSASKKVLASALSAAMVVAFAPTVALGEVLPTSGNEASVTTAPTAANPNGVTTEYADLQEALTTAPAGSTVKLLKSLTGTDAVDYNAVNAITFDFNGNSIAGDKDTAANAELTVALPAGSSVVDANIAAYTATNATKNQVAQITIGGTVIDAEGATVTGSATLNATGTEYTVALNAAGLAVAGSATSGTAATESADGTDSSVLTITVDGAVADVLSVDGTAVVVKSGTFMGIENDADDTPITSHKGCAAGTDESADHTAKTKTVKGLTIKGGTFAGGTIEDPTTHAIEVVYSLNNATDANAYIAGGDFQGYVMKSAGDDSTIEISGGTFANKPAGTIAAGKNLVKSGDVYTVVAGSSVAFNTPEGTWQEEQGTKANGTADTKATDAVKAAAQAWYTEINQLQLPAALTLEKDVTIADLFTAINAGDVTTTVSTSAAWTEPAVNAASTEAAKKQAADAQAIDAAIAAANLTGVKNKVSTVGEGNEVEYRIATAADPDFTATRSYRAVFADGTTAPVEVVTKDDGTKVLSVKTAQMGSFALAYTDIVEDGKATIEELQAELDAAKAELEQAKKDSEAAAAAAAAQVAALQDQVAAASVAGKTKTVTLGAKKTKTAKAKSVTLAAVASASGATMTFAKASGSAKITVTEAGKVKLAKGVKRGTYKATVTAAVGTALKNVTVKFVIQ